MIFMSENKYGYCVNILDDRIRPRYEQFKKEKGIPLHFPCSDAERLEFEAKIKKEFMEKYPERYAEILKYIKENSPEH